MQGKRSWFLTSTLAFGFAFLYVPILLLIVYSFNESRLVTVWSGLSTKWYAALLEDDKILGAAWVSLKVAFMNANIAVVLGTLVAFALIRFGQFRGRTLLSAMSTAPLVMPEVITGFSLLLLFVTLQQTFDWWPANGVTTITIAHATFSTAYVAVVIQSRLMSFERDVEEAALDLGARPWKVFLTITLPIIAPALLAGWLLSFTLSLDDLVIAQFVTGPSASTLPMVVFSSVRLGVSPKINALATLLVLAATFAIIIAAWASSRQARQDARLK